MGGNQGFAGERRRCWRQTVHAPAFASFDGVTGGMILDLSEEGLSMQTGGARNGQLFEKERRVRVKVDLPADVSEPDPSTAEAHSDTHFETHFETTGYIAWADALGRAGVRFSDLPEEARRRLNDWLTLNASAPSHMAPKVALGRMAWPAGVKSAGSAGGDPMAVSLEAENLTVGGAGGTTSATVQYEFSSLGTDLTAALRLIGERARSLTRGSSAAIALLHKGSVICRASVGEKAPALGTRLDVNSGLSGECFRVGRALRCDDTEMDPRVDLESCRRLGVRSILAAPVRYERGTVGLLMVFATDAFNFDEGDVAVVESLAHTVIVSMRRAQPAEGG
ncbi:MAG: GAF domain-containing protein [Candidatus Sulfotelmatobacter sp.]